MSSLVPCYLEPHVFAELRRLAVLAGSESKAVERLIDFWNTNQSDHHKTTICAHPPVSKPPIATWRSSSGDELPVGARLEATYKGRTYYASVERQGIRFGKSLYQSPSAAGRAVKNSVGVSGPAAQTDGRSFWSVRDPSSGRLVSIGDLNPKKLIDTEELLRELAEEGSTPRRP